MGLVTTKPVFGISDLKPVSSGTEASYKIEISLVASLDDTFQNVNNKGADQSTKTDQRFVVRKQPDRFSRISAKFEITYCCVLALSCLGAIGVERGIGWLAGV